MERVSHSIEHIFGKCTNAKRLLYGQIDRMAVLATDQKLTASYAIRPLVTSNIFPSVFDLHYPNLQARMSISKSLSPRI